MRQASVAPPPPSCRSTVCCRVAGERRSAPCGRARARRRPLVCRLGGDGAASAPNNLPPTFRRRFRVRAPARLPACGCCGAGISR